MDQSWRSSDGRIRLYHDDLRNVLPTFGEGELQFIFTDPPYGHNNNDGDFIHSRRVFSKSKKNRRYTEEKKEIEGRPIMNDGKEIAEELVKFLFKQSARLLPKGGCLACCCVGGGPDPQFARWSLWMAKCLDFKQQVIWNKGWGLGWHYHRCYEVVLVGERPGAKSRWFGGKKVGNVIGPGDYGIRKIIPSADHHPTEQPRELPQHFIRLHTEEDDVVCDPFMGSGSTLEAAVRMSRRFIGIELDKHWFDHSVRRAEKCIARAASSFGMQSKVRK